MLRNILILVCFFILTGSENKPKWKSLFNGKDLKGWEVKIAGYPLGKISEIHSVLKMEYSRQDIMRMIVSGSVRRFVLQKSFYQLPVKGGIPFHRGINTRRPIMGLS
jgi:hypothetical protein